MEKEEQIKEAFQRVREDIGLLKKENNQLWKGLVETRERLIELCSILEQINKKIFSKKPLSSQIPLRDKQTDTSTPRHIISTVSTHPSTHPTHFKPLNTQILGISTGNQGVPTDRQTDKQTNRQTQINLYNQEKNLIEDASEMLNSLDNIKKEIRLKFKRLTDQEILVFSTLYQLEEEQGPTDYKSISKKLNLTESSIRDYVGRLIKKGIPVEKKKINNKNINLSISKNLKKIASLQTILQLRDL